MTPFDLVEPASLDEAIALLDPDDPTVRPIAGGTALMLMMKAGVFRPTRLVSLRKLGARYSSVAAGKDRALTTRALTPLPAGSRHAPRAPAPPRLPPPKRRPSHIPVLNQTALGPQPAHLPPRPYL